MRDNIKFWDERVDLAAAFRWTARLNMHEGVANHFSLSIDDDGTKFLMNPNQVHFSRIKASDMIVVDANDPDTLSGPNAPDPTAWGLHSGIHRGVPTDAVCMCIRSTRPCWRRLPTAACHQSTRMPAHSMAATWLMKTMAGSRLRKKGRAVPRFWPTPRIR